MFSFNLILDTMRCLALLLLVFTLFTSCFAAVSIGRYHDPDHPGKCVIKSDLIFEPGEHPNPQAKCGRIFCSADGTVQFQTCGVIRLAPVEGCVIEEPDLTLPYPACCHPKQKC